MTPVRRRVVPASRLVEVAPERLTGWVERFAASHGALAASRGDDALHLVAEDGAVALLEVPWPLLAAVPAGEEGGRGGSVDLVRALASHAALPRTALVALVRRGGFAVGTARGGELLDHRTGTRYVQARTAAGGWSQQRYARRRTGQADALASAAAQVVLSVVARAPSAPEVLVVGGDRPLLATVLADPRLAAVAALPRAPLLDVADPRLDVLAAAAARARAVRVRVRS